MPKAYAVFRFTIDDAARFAEYIPGASSSAMRYGGTVLVAADDGALLEGSLPSSRTVILEFPSREAADGWYGCAEYQAVRPFRQAATSNASAAIYDAFMPPGA